MFCSGFPPGKPRGRDQAIEEESDIQSHSNAKFLQGTTSKS